MFSHREQIAFLHRRLLVIVRDDDVCRRRAQILRLLIELRKRLGLTMIFISHDLALVHHLCR